MVKRFSLGVIIILIFKFFEEFSNISVCDNVRDVRAKMFYSIDSLKLLLRRTDNELLVSEMEKNRVTDFVSKCVEN